MENPNRNFKSQTCEDFIEVLASKAAVPGGGGASALAGAIGIALGNMVGSLTVGKKTYADVEEKIIECKKQADEIAKEFLELMDKDAEAFEPLSKAYGLPKSTPEELAKKEEIMEEALNTACSVPIEIMKTCARGIDLVEVFAAKGSRIALSDAGVGATLLKSAIRAASARLRSISSGRSALSTRSSTNVGVTSAMPSPTSTSCSSPLTVKCISPMWRATSTGLCPACTPYTPSLVGRVRLSQSP